jgi:hypothetical protein
MTIIEILQGLYDGRFHQGEILECDDCLVEILTDSTFQITYPSRKSEIRELLLANNSAYFV